ncbi:MAG: DUF748 domain-containing protein [Deltaproteobacteria bacterium]|nr:DUF748 domain-containing protein [Deltaproteobacteria bacterium]
MLARVLASIAPIAPIARIAFLLVILPLAACLLLFLLFVLVLPVYSDGLQAELDRRASKTVGASVRSSSLSFVWLPPGIRIQRPEVIPAEGVPSPLEAESMDLRLHFTPLLRGRVAPRSIEIRGAVLRLVRDGGELRLEGSGAARASPSAGQAKQSEGSSPALAFEDLHILDGRIVLRDPAAGPDTRLRVDDIQARLEPHSSGSMAIRARGALGEGGHFTSDGSFGQGRLELATRLESVDLSYIAALVGGVSELSGRAEGRIVLESEGWRPQRFVADLQVASATLRAEPVEMVGTVGLHAEWTQDLARPGLRFRLEATHAELRYGEAYHKASGVSAHVTGELSSAADGSLGVDDLHLVVGGTGTGE